MAKKYDDMGNLNEIWVDEQIKEHDDEVFVENFWAEINNEQIRTDALIRSEFETRFQILSEYKGTDDYEIAKDALMSI